MNMHLLVALVLLGLGGGWRDRETERDQPFLCKYELLSL